MAAALAAARAGAGVTLVEESPRVGGTVADCLIHTLGGLFDDAGELLNDGLPAELADALHRADPATSKRRIGRVWVLGACPEVYRSVCTRWLAEAGVRVLCGSRIVRVNEAGGRITTVTTERDGDIPAGAVVDATGTAGVTRLLDGSELTRDALGVGERLVGFLRGVAGFAGATVIRAGRLGVREGGRVRGEYTLTADDVRQGRRSPDPACRCAWPVEFWDSRSGVSLEYLPAGAWYEVPLRALRVAGVANLWAAGKCLSADPQAQASARIAGNCWAMGEAAGHAAAE
jgi:hypothetical protein